MAGSHPILPVIMDKLRGKGEGLIGKDFDDLYNQIEEATAVDKREGLREEMERAIEVGEDLGILSFKGGEVRLAFSLGYGTNQDLICPKLRKRCAELCEVRRIRKVDEPPPEEDDKEYLRRWYN